MAKLNPKKTQLSTLDFTLKFSTYANSVEVHKLVRGWFKKYVFQHELSDKGYEHWQGRGVLNKRRTWNGLLASDLFKSKGSHFSVTSNAVKGSFSYVMKADTRVEGTKPETDKDYVEPAVLTRQLRNYMKFEPRHWQNEVHKLVCRLDDRTITCVVDQVGNIGKSIFCEWLEYMKLAFEIPPMISMEDIMQCAMAVPPQKCYIVDMPRAMKKDKLYQFYSGLEALKNGVMYDKRYSFRKRRIDRPQVLVFSNKFPNLEYLSRDRWEIYTITPDYKLEPWTAPK